MKRVKKSKAEIMKVMGSECRYARVYRMSKTLQELSDMTGINVKTLSAFENGRSSNLYIFYVYLTHLDNEEIARIIDSITIQSEVL